MKKQMKEEKEKNPDKFIDIEEALNVEKKDDEMFALGLLAHNLQVNGIEIGIEKNESIDEELLNENITSLQFITNSMNEKKKYDYILI